MKRAMFIVALLIATSAQAKDVPWKPWPCSQCTNGWVDAMTGMCPYRPKCSKRAVPEHRMRHE